MQLSKYQQVAILFLFFALFSCSSNNDTREINFYHWKTELKLDKSKKEYLENIGLKKLYVRFFDVKWVE